MVRELGKIFRLGIFAGLGLLLGVLAFTSFMVVEVEGSSMLPTLEPGDQVLVLRSSVMKEGFELDTGDLVVYEVPYYTTSGEGLEIIRRITGKRGDWIRLNCDVQTVENQEILVAGDEILGRAIFDLSSWQKL